MSFIALIFALTLSYYLPHRHADKFKRFFSMAITHLTITKTVKLQNKYNDILAWLVIALLPSLAIAIIFYFCNHFLPLFGLLINVTVLYFTLTFNGLFNKPEQIVTALRSDDNALANNLYREWVPHDPEISSNLTNTTIARKSIEVSLQRGHYQWFAPIFWFVIFSAIGLGVAGVVLYRLSDVLALEPVPTDPHRMSSEKSISKQIFIWLDTPPAHLTGWGFAIMGDFEDALYCWREQAATWRYGINNEKNKGIILTSGAGALGVKLGENLPALNGIIQPTPEIGLGDDADADYLHSAIALVWRTLVLMLGLLLLLTFAYWLGN